MTQPVQTPFLLQAALYATATTAMTGCAMDATGGAALGVGVVVGVTATYALFRRFSRMRGPENQAPPPAVVLATPAPQERPPFRLTSAAQIEAVKKRLFAPEPPSSQVEGAFILLIDLGLGHPDKEIETAAAGVLLEAVRDHRRLITHKRISMLGDALNRRTDEATGSWIRDILLEISAKLPESPEALHAVDLLGVDRLRAVLRSNGDILVTTRALFALTAMILTADDPKRSAEAEDALVIDGLNHQDPNVAVLAAGRLIDIANRNHARLSLLPLVILRTKGFSKTSSRTLTQAFVEALAQIAAPEKGVSGGNPRVPEKSLQILFDDGLTHPDEEISSLVRDQLRAAYVRRPDIFSQDQRERLATRQ